ncbi:MAG: DUF1934 family protein [Oscillospiraceae bacterium]|nr:DUF1934 family protein [Oscillospiraceae bacterium]
MGGAKNPKSKKFDFRIKIIQTDLISREYSLMMEQSLGGGFGFGGDPVMFQNSDYISKLYFLNNYSGGILSKENLEDMPARYRAYVNYKNPSIEERLKELKKEIAALADREEIGQNVFYSQFSGAMYGGVDLSAAASDHGFELPPELEDFLELGQGGFDDDEYGDYDEYDEDDKEYEDGEGYDEYGDDGEILDILQLNNFFDSEAYKMSKVKYEFCASGTINSDKNGLFVIEYDESEMTGIKGSRIRITFNTKNKDLVSVHRPSYSNSWFALQKGKAVAIEHGELAGDTLSTTTSKLKNNMSLSGGSLHMVYTNEKNGMPLELISYSINAKLAET